MPALTMTREWAMPSRWTFTIPACAEVIRRYLTAGWVDPFAGEHSPAQITNDIEPRGCTYQMDGLAFLRQWPSASINGVLFDPPYSTEQALRLYTPRDYRKGTCGRTEYWAKCKDEIGRIVKHGGYVVSFGWDSCGIGEGRGFALLEIKLLCHGAAHNDTIITVEQKTSYDNWPLFEEE